MFKDATIKEPSNYAKMDDNTLEYDGSGKATWLGWIVVGVYAATLIGGGIACGIINGRTPVDPFKNVTGEGTFSSPFVGPGANEKSFSIAEKYAAPGTRICSEEVLGELGMHYYSYSIPSGTVNVYYLE